MKILMISEYFYPENRGGGEISAFLLAQHLVKKGLDVHVLTSHFKGLKRIETIKGVIIHRNLKSGKNPRRLIDNFRRLALLETSILKELKELHQKENYQIIHCLNASSISAIKLKSKINCKFVLHINSPVLFCPKGTLMYKDEIACEKRCDLKTYTNCYLHSKLFGKLAPNPMLKYNPLFFYAMRKRFLNYQRLLVDFDHYFAISTFMQDKLMFSGVKKTKIDVIYNIVGLNRFLKTKSKKNKLPKLLYLGEYSQPKGPQLIAEALRGIKIKYSCNFYGEGVLKSYLETKVREYGLSIKINNAAPYEKIPEIIAAHDIIIVPSIVGEAFSRVTLEAAACGKTVVAANVGGISDIISSKTGYLFEVNNTQNLRIMLVKAINQRIPGNIIRSSISKKFDNQVSVKRVVSIFKELTK